MTRSALWMLLFLMSWPCLSPAADEDVPEALEPFRSFVKQCKQWHHRDRDLAWKTTYVEKFDQGPEHWRKASRYARPQVTNGTKELLITPPYGSTAFVPIGPKINGQFAIELVGRAVGEKAVPLSIMLGTERGEGPGFQFATRRNGQHLLWTDTVEYQDGDFGPKSFGNEPKLVINQTYRVRLEVRKNEVAGYVDGKLFGKAALSADYDWDKLRQPTAMTVVSPIVISSYRIEKFVPTQGPKQKKTDAEAWQTIFGEKTETQIEAEAAELVQMLDADDWAVREAAGPLIRDVGYFARPALERGIESGPPELKWRAEKLLPAITRKPTNTGDAKQ